MSFHLSFDKYLSLLDQIHKVQSDYKNYTHFDDKKREIEAACKSYLSDAQNAYEQLRAIKRTAKDTYDKMAKLLERTIPAENGPAPTLTGIQDLADALAAFNELGAKIEKAGGTEPQVIRQFGAAYQKLQALLAQCETGRFSLATYQQGLEQGRADALRDVEQAIKALYGELRMLVGFSNEDARAHCRLASAEKTLFTSGFHFSEKLENGIKLGNATIAVNSNEAAFMRDICPEIQCKNQQIAVPYVFPINSPSLSRKSNIYIEYDEQTGSDAAEQISITVHQLILKMISDCPLGNLVLRCADLTEKNHGRFVYINARMKGAINKIKDRDIAALLTANLCAPEINNCSEMFSMVQKEFKATKDNQFKLIEGADITHYLYTYFGFSHEVGADACDQLKRTFELDQGCGTVGVHNIIVVNRADIKRANAVIAQVGSTNRDAEAAKAWLEVLNTIKSSSDCFEYTDNGRFRLTNKDNTKRTILVQLGEAYFPSLQSYAVAEQKLIDTIEQCNVDTGTPFVDLVGEDAFVRKGDFTLGEYADDGEKLMLSGHENIAVIFADNSFSPDEKSRIMSSLTLSTMTANQPGQKRLCFMSNQRNAHVLNVMNGLEGQVDGIQYSLLEDDKNQSTQQRTEHWRDSIRSISKILHDKKQSSGNKNYDISDLIKEDSTKYLRVVYDEFSDDGQRHDDNIRTLVDTVVKLSRETNGSVQCILEINSDTPNVWQKSFGESGVFDFVIVAKNHSFVSLNNRRLKLSVLADKDDAQTIAYDMLNRYIKASVASPTYEEIGFGSQKVDAAGIGSTLEIPVGRRDGMPFSMGFDSKGNGIIGYMVQGTTGSGKSSLLFSIIYNGAMKYSPEALQFYLLDFKDGTSFDEFRNSKNPIPHVRQLSIKNDQEDADAIFRNLEDEVARRSILFKKYGAKEISEYNKGIAGGRIREQYMPRLVIMIDECQNAFYAMDSSGMRMLNDLLVNRFESLTRVGRSYGIHFIVATQRMEARLAEKIGAQLSGRCSFKMNSVDDACALLAHSVASRVNNLPRYGAMLYSNDAGKSCTQVQVAYDYGKFGQYASHIRDAYPASGATFEIGNEDALRISASQLEGGKYLSDRGDALCLPLAQNCMKDENLSITFSQNQNQALLMVGENPALASNIMVSLLHSMGRLSPEPAKTTLYSYTLNTPAVNLARRILGNQVQITNDANALLTEIYQEIETRDALRRNATAGSIPRFQPWLVVLDGIRKDIFEEARMPAATAVSTSLIGAASTQRVPTALSKSSAPAASPQQRMPERSAVWQKITETAAEVGIHLCVYLSDPRTIPASRDYFKGYKHLITFPCQALKECVRQRAGISIPMESTLGDKHVAFGASLSANASVCYYITDADTAEEGEVLSGGPKVYKIKPYMFT